MATGAVGILVLNYNSRPFLKDCLHSLIRQTYGNFEIFLIDNHSSDGSAAFVRQNFPAVRVIENGQDYGLGRGFNEGIRRIHRDFEYVALLNSDIQCDPGWLEETVNTLRSRPEAAASTGLTLDWEGKIVDNAGGRVMNLLMGIFGGFLTGVPLEDIPYGFKHECFRVFLFIANALVIRSSAFTRFGFFDEGFFMHFSDIDFSWRISLGGGGIWCQPKAVVRHYGYGAKNPKQTELKMAQSSETNLLATYFKNLSAGTLLVLLPLVGMIRALISLIYIPISPRITLRKLKGLAVFLFGLITGRYRQGRRLAQGLRTLSDRQALAMNNGPLFSIVPIMKLFYPWFKWIEKNYLKWKIQGSQG